MAVHDGIVFDVAGDGEPGTVLVHAGIADRHQWDEVWEGLATESRTVRYDVRGFGESADPDVDFFDHEDLLAVMTAAGVERAVLVGASSGGRIVLDAALSAPDRVAGLVLVGAALVGIPTGARLQALFDEEEAALARGDIAAAVEVNLRTWVDGIGRDRGDEAVRTRVAAWLEALLPRQATAAGGEAQLVEPLVRDRLGEITVPALVVVGEHDQPRMQRVAGYLAAAIRHARLEVVAGAAHLPDLERPALVLPLVADFVDDVVRADRAGR